MKIILFGATGMIGQGVLRECLLASDVELVETVGREATGLEHPKLREVGHREMRDYSAIERELTGFDACFFCLGVTSAGMSEADYERVTYGITIAAAETLARLNAGMTRLPFKGAYMFRPGVIQPLYGVKSKTGWYRMMYTVTRPLLTPPRMLVPAYILTTEQMGRAMLAVARRGAPKSILESRDIALISRGP